MSLRNMTQVLDTDHPAEREGGDQLLPVVYEELRGLATSYLSRENSGHTLQPTALVHEAYLRMVEQDRSHWQDRSHFFRVAAQMMRRVLVDHSRVKKAQKRGGGGARVTLVDGLLSDTPRLVDILALDAALTRLAEIDTKQARVVEMRFFGGLTVEETASALGIGTATVKRDWALAKAWLFVELNAAMCAATPDAAKGD